MGNTDSEMNKKVRTKKIIIICTSIIVVMIPLLIFLNSKFSNANEKVSASEDETSQTDNNKPEAKEPEKPEKPKLDNSGYILLENDPSADDAVMVSENTNGLLTGTKQYPVREDGKKVVYLTFDDGPSTTNTPEVLNILDRYNIKGTFFVMGQSINTNDRSKEILKQIAKDGHAIANHTYGHDYKYLYPNRVMNVDHIVADVEKNDETMKQVLGKDFSTRVIRFPGGYWSWKGRGPMKEKMVQDGYVNLDWDALNGDAEGKKKDAAELLQKTKETVEALGPNADSVVILMHDTYGKEETVKALPQIIEYLQGQGYEFRTVK